MRRLLLLLTLLAIVVSCDVTSSKYGQGGKNAAQFVKEMVPSNRDDIESIETISEDSLLSDIGLMFAQNRLSSIKSAYYNNKIPYSEVDRVVDSCIIELMYVEQSWKYGNISKKMEKFNGQWRKVYTVRVTMKSGIIKEPRVLMEQDGITPRMIERDFEDKLRRYRISFSN